VEVKRGTAGKPVEAGHVKTPSIFVHGLRLGDRLYTFILIRFLVVGAIVVGAFFAPVVVGIQDLDVAGLVSLAAVLGGCNVITFLVVRPYHRNADRAAEARRFLEGVLHVTIFIDFICLTVAIWLVGGPQSPFQAFFIFHVIIASVLLSTRAAYIHTGIGYVLLTALVVGTWRGWIPPHYPRGAVPCGGILEGRYILTLLVVQGMLFALTALLLTHLMNLLRTDEAELVDANEELSRLSEMRRDFLHIAMHNLRSPVGAVSMMLSNMTSGYGGTLSEQHRQWVDRSQQRLEELSRFIHDLQFLSATEAGALEEHAEPVDMRDLLGRLVEENQDLARAREHVMTFESDDEAASVAGIPRLLREALVNLITNAITYTPEGGRITVRVQKRDQRVRVEVEDNGIGIALEDQGRLFQEFVRVQRDDAPTTKAPGSGLGLSIVRRIVEAHGGRVQIISELDKGSTFVVELPAA